MKIINSEISIDIWMTIWSNLQPNEFPTPPIYVNEYGYLSSKFFIDILMVISDIELEFMIFIVVKKIIHVYNLCCKKYLVTVKNRML